MPIASSSLLKKPRLVKKLEGFLSICTEKTMEKLGQKQGV